MAGEPRAVDPVDALRRLLAVQPERRGKGETR
jgi:hypothetical protein